MSSFSLYQNGDFVDGIPVMEYGDSAEANTIPQTQSDCYDVGEEFGEHDILPRIGDEYQVELPTLTTEPNRMSHTEIGNHSLQDFFVGLPIPLIWINCGKNNCPQIALGSRRPHHKNVIEKETLCNGDSESSHNSVKVEIKSLPAVEKIRICIDEGHLLVPGSLCESWSDAEKASFVLALYIFEKNFVEVRRFVGSKGMGAILSFYYGEFYGSDAYRRWSEGRKTKSKKCVYGQRIFSGLRQQEFLSRLFSRVSEKCKSSLLEVSKTFGEDKISLVDYISSLKATVGMDLIVEAVGVGLGKQDLTGMALEPLRSNHVTRSEIPAGKACSTLTTAEIIKFLSGDYRLSKARSNDLFWEAVWPRLLARGWHSEQPQNQGYIAGSKFLVFLLPGVKKFSRRKLVKGDHYFDSVTDVLSKVAKDPGLIELDNVEANGDQNMEKDEWSSDVKIEEDENHLPSRQRHSYLQPRTPNRSMDAIKFTVVDTGLPDGKIRELRTLPREISSIMISLGAPVEENMAESDMTCKSGPKKLASRKNRDDGKPAAHPKREKDSNDNQKPRKVSKPVLSRKQKQGYVENIAPPSSKRCRKLSGNTHEEARDGVLLHPHSTSTAPRLENRVSCSSSGGHESNETTQLGLWQDKLSSASSSRGSPSESTEFPQPQLLIDLNLPHVPLEIENNGLTPNLPNNQLLQPDSHGLPAAPSPVEASSEQQCVANTRRLSTRYRPPTTRALEAVAGGYLSVSRKRKGRDTSSLDAPSRPSQKSRVWPGRSESPSSSMASSPSQMRESSSQIAEADRAASTSGTSKAYNHDDDPPEANQDEPAPRQ
ncbi:hypothetical protein SASPL_147192 [Salvia splendens]|uniref:SANT domain-containing protein n=2 Tax=Salvia splendens TaxID=180675 RepID=A0A8X8WDK9_SALSN|nr:uncharacterized protein LOC121777620 isoform X2 [Salvia splendens]XP_042030868.1 uncharacterized protein LOC121777620 isoform X2 [Salvia splendens]XP_042030869.1 uncharacterized protein LOC121777620 isoform X2 [Salvia splendens]KAG6392963.1 hypothetical protein SASPL_147192 [Salvia splendens]